MKCATISATKQKCNTTVFQQPQPQKNTVTQKIHVLSQSPCEDPQARIAKRAYELYCERGYRNGFALDDWLDAEQEILSQIPAL
ncbi:MAG: hypothetical protein RL768_2089 [Nitrospirota bacterium]|jgi:hypothetical protein